MTENSMNEICSRLRRIENLQSEILTILPNIKNQNNKAQKSLNNDPRDNFKLKRGFVGARGYRIPITLRRARKNRLNLKSLIPKDITESSDNSTRPRTEQSHSSHVSVSLITISDEKINSKNSMKSLLVEEASVGMSCCENNYKGLKDSSVQTSAKLLNGTKRKRSKKKKILKEIRPTNNRTEEKHTFFSRLLEHFDYCTMNEELVETNYPQDKTAGRVQEPSLSIQEETQRVLASATRVPITETNPTCIPFLDNIWSILNDLFV